MAHPGNPMDTYHNSVPSPPAMPTTTITIANIPCTIHGLSTVPKDAPSLSVLFLLHPRLQTAATMSRFATSILTAYASTPASATKPLITLSFDQRNHGSRLTDPLRNEAWRQGNPSHAQDMFATYRGTAADVSTLIAALPGALPAGTPPATEHLVLGVSLGAHAAWLCAVHEPRVTAAVSIIGCPDFARLMAHRATKSKLADWDDSTPKGARFFGSASFPEGLMDEMEKTDPAGLLLPHAAQAAILPPMQEPSAKALEPDLRRGWKAKIQKRLGGKAVLSISGGKDKLVPYSCGEPFLQYLKTAVGTWWKDGCYLEDVVVSNAGHETTKVMVDWSVEFLLKVLNGRIETSGPGTSKI